MSPNFIASLTRRRMSGSLLNPALKGRAKIIATLRVANAQLLLLGQSPAERRASKATRERRCGSAARCEAVASPCRSQAVLFWAAPLVRALPKSIPVFKGQARTRCRTSWEGGLWSAGSIYCKRYRPTLASAILPKYKDPLCSTTLAICA
jgi:hypothetical protein